ncbi:MAG TPA: hypothetical protein VGD59_15055 [Acidisarcina sp.]
MGERSAFWKGIGAGLLAATGIGLLKCRIVARSPASSGPHDAANPPRSWSPASGSPVSGSPPSRSPGYGSPGYGSTQENASATSLASTLATIAGTAADPPLRRDSPESAGDPRLTSPGTDPGGVEGRALERPPGAPGGFTPEERLDLPGRPGQQTDYAQKPHRSGPAREDGTLEPEQPIW